jgi:hypothetical protein
LVVRDGAAGKHRFRGTFVGKSGALPDRAKPMERAKGKAGRGTPTIPHFQRESRNGD